MLKGIDPVLSPDLLWVLASMGHGDDLALVDSNHPAEAIARATTSGRLVRLPGLAIDRVAEAILSVFPLDSFVDDPVRRMQVVGKPDEIPDVQHEIAALAAKAAPGVAIASIERFAFYDAARKAFAVVQAGDPRPYGCFLLRKGVIAGEKP
ncbi:RbsD/FucU family protein [Terrarubrum flagellatum]|uniref:RbsD/FucU family protein n=1 Tax=Terrirubrum flagellatum TaxID=2895980 RepID=UPI0031453B50